MKRPTNRQLKKIAARLQFYDWTDLELSELVRRIRRIKPTKEYADRIREMVEEMTVEGGEAGRLAAILNQVESEIHDNPKKEHQ